MLCMACGIATYAKYCYECDRAVHKIPYKSKHHRQMMRTGEQVIMSHTIEPTTSTPIEPL